CCGRHRLYIIPQVHSGRKLEWLYHLGHGEMVTHCFQKTYRIYSSTFQMGLVHQ
ncbi:unnamed protein product, partial [Scytosiphon promiscuus]